MNKKTTKIILENQEGKIKNCPSCGGGELEPFIHENTISIKCIPCKKIGPTICFLIGDFFEHPREFLKIACEKWNEAY